ncbi:hypothetical protein EGR_08692 [Echinococcus granulosus]|uniref:Uncharacterized protein n=1 Tax=Echinococcus granulosus TaxID=6210 RepID=W6UDM5_ECHGR|nr:hypothetical protein EGR_08692 [Echinococcus granulosus]EUB56427.1 hypothetical protein EGR_08692 [Echinococcus granulosus]
MTAKSYPEKYEEQAAVPTLMEGNMADAKKCTVDARQQPFSYNDSIRANRTVTLMKVTVGSPPTTDQVPFSTTSEMPITIAVMKIKSNANSDQPCINQETFIPRPSLHPTTRQSLQLPPTKSTLVNPSQQAHGWMNGSGKSQGLENPLSVYGGRGLLLSASLQSHRQEVPTTMLLQQPAEIS